MLGFGEIAADVHVPVCLYLYFHFSTHRHLVATDFQESDVARLADVDTQRYQPTNTAQCTHCFKQGYHFSGISCNLYTLF